MAQLQANRTLSGSFASVWVDGALIAELESITVKVKLQRERVQLGMDVDSKITGYSGEGTMKLKQVYTRFYEVLDEARRGVDKRCTITTALKDPDSVDGQEERYAIAGVAFTERRSSTTRSARSTARACRSPSVRANSRALTPSASANDDAWGRSRRRGRTTPAHAGRSRPVRWGR